ncbi:MAG: hypothetical protein CBD74_06575 [Saprospirales bacterium TMED214]|nr:MAG: hypothetical protein CBD74_06575 [Saprospirales bacterium TMED214]
MFCLYVIAILLNSVMSDGSTFGGSVGHGFFAQQVPPGFADAMVASPTPQASAGTSSGTSELDISELGNRNGQTDRDIGNRELDEDLDAHSKELRKAVEAGTMTEEAARKAWDEAKAQAKKQRSDKGEDAAGEDGDKGWIRQHLALFLTVVYGGIFALIISILAICFLYVARREKARTAALGAATAELGLTFEAAGDDSLMGDLSPLPLFNRGRRKKLTNLIVADTPDLQVHVFDYVFVTGYGRSQTTHRTTVVSLRSDTLVLPSLQVRPRKAFADGIKAIFGAGGIEMDQYPEFAKTHVVQSDQPQQACDFLDAEMVNVCENNPDCSLECHSGVLLHFRAGKRVDANAESIRDFIGEGFQLFQNVSDRLQRNG